MSCHDETVVPISWTVRKLWANYSCNYRVTRRSNAFLKVKCSPRSGTHYTHIVTRTVTSRLSCQCYACLCIARPSCRRAVFVRRPSIHHHRVANPYRSFWQYSDGDHQWGGGSNAWGMKKIAIFDQYWRYLENDKRQRQLLWNAYKKLYPSFRMATFHPKHITTSPPERGRFVLYCLLSQCPSLSLAFTFTRFRRFRIQWLWTRTRSIDNRIVSCQWCRVTSNPDCNVMPLFDTEHLGNGRR